MSESASKSDKKSDECYNATAITSNAESLEFGRTCQSCAAGIAAGILGLTGFNGFILFFLSVGVQALFWNIKAQGNWLNYFPERNSFTWSIGNGLFTFVLLWVFFYGMVHVY
ncbi:unnamed protein product [Caenorhabditis angaria]|uniref:ER membrane protein complex subunit 6 n=1 Tax=Caenorhabditis angaria TaxID=860376 RepID=A0A9P1IPN5_9PELO|nr:unnamed protein product [Caenorhabditis angaria]